MRFSKSESKMFSEIGLTAGEVAFASLFASFFAVDRKNLVLVLLSLILTLIFWGSSWFLTRRFKL
jgi:NADH:ubiquinone oxidoreductase subunit 6 (subunit J)